MKVSSIASIVVFSSEMFDKSRRGFPEDINEPPLGRDVAVYFTERLQRDGFQISNASPLKGEGGWTLRVICNHAMHSLFILWIPFESIPHDRWAIQIRRHTGLFRGMLLRQRSEVENQLLHAIRDIITKDDRFENVQWLTPDQFRAIY